MLPIGTGIFPWAAGGRSFSLGRDEGITKLLFDSDATPTGSSAAASSGRLPVT
jgi:hypothetical protein